MGFRRAPSKGSSCFLKQTSSSPSSRGILECPSGALTKQKRALGLIALLRGNDFSEPLLNWWVIGHHLAQYEALFLFVYLLIELNASSASLLPLISAGESKS